ncbi:MAG: hypothetical protein CMF51_03850 [Legionellales bacterium]|nr:hypothetical protein [Legionellales bacterium]
MVGWLQIQLSLKMNVMDKVLPQQMESNWPEWFEHLKASWPSQAYSSESTQLNIQPECEAWLAEHQSDEIYRIVWINGVLNVSCSSWPVLNELDQVITTLPSYCMRSNEQTAWLKAYLEERSGWVQWLPNRAESLLNISDGICIDLLRPLDRPLHLIHWVDESIPSNHMTLQHMIRLGEGVSLDLCQWSVGSNPVSAEFNVDSHICLAEKAHLNISTIQQLPEGVTLRGLETMCLDAHAQCQATYWGMGASCFEQHTDIRLRGLHSHYALRELIDLNGTQCQHHHVHVHHQAESTDSQQTFCVLGQDRSKGQVLSRVIVDEGAFNIDSKQSARGMLLSPGAQIEVSPELEIYADAVQCQHGASVGALDADALRYLTARGISLDQAQQLLIQALIRNVLPDQPNSKMHALMMKYYEFDEV